MFLDTEAIVMCGGVSARAEPVTRGGETGGRQEGIHWKESVSDLDQSGLSRRYKSLSWESDEMMRRDEVVAWTGESGLIDRRRRSRECKPRYNGVASRLVLILLLC